MSRILSQEEIDMLLAATAGARAAEPAAEPPGIVAYNFRRPDRVSKEQLRSLHFLHDRFALNVSTSLSAFLRAMTEVSIVSADQLAYSEFVTALPDSTAFYSVSLHPLDGLGALELGPAVAFAMVDRLLGGTGLTPGPSRPLTEIEQNVIDSVVKLLLESLSETWKPVADMQFRIHGRDTRPQMLQVAGPNEIVILLVFDIRIAETRGRLNVCIPASSMEAIGEKFTQGGWQRSVRRRTAAEEAWLCSNLGRIPLPVTALLETTLPARELLALRVGDVIAIGHAAAAPVDVHVGTVPRFRGRLARCGTNAGVIIDGPSDEGAGRQEGAAA